MHKTAHSASTSSPRLSRRSFVGSIPATFLIAACGSGPAAFGSNAASAETIDHSLWDKLLGEYVVAGSDGVNLVDYARLQDEAADELQAYLDAMQGVTIEDFSRDEQYAFWVNLYNAATVDVILRNYPLDSIRDIGLLGQGPWKDDAVTVSGRVLTLDNIEHDILRPNWQDVRIHYAVNCASIGCPNLARRAYTSERLEPMLEEAAAAYVNHPRGFARRDGRIIASNIYDWYQEDWGSVGDVLDHARQYATGPTARLLEGVTEIDSYDYDWSLNDI